MTRIRISPGSCGFSTTASVEKKEKKTFSLSIESDCELIRKFAESATELHYMDAFKRMVDNPVYQAASKAGLHTPCPVPSGILKALEAEAGLNTKKKVTMEFID